MTHLKISMQRDAVTQKYPTPTYATIGSAGIDLIAALPQSLILQAHTYELINTGLFLSIPNGYEGQIRPRSGIALKYGVTVLNAPGTIDSDYRGMIKVILINHGENPFEITPGMRIAQLVIAPVIQANFIESKTELRQTQRGVKGFGSSGL